MKTLLAALLIAVLLLPAIVHGPRITPDGVHYLSLAENLVAGRGLTIWNGTRNFCHPPGYGLALAPLRWLKFSRGASVLILNALALLVIFAATLALVKPLTGWTAWAAAAIVTASPTLVTSGLMALTETVFVALMLTFLLSVNGKRIWLASLLALALCGVRYHGLAVVVAVALVCFPRWRDKLVVALPSLAVLLGGVAITGAWKPYVMTKYNMTPAYVNNLLNIMVVPMDCAQYIGGAVLLTMAVYVVWRLRRQPVAVATFGYYAGLLMAAFIMGYPVIGSRIHAPGITLLLVALIPVLPTWGWSSVEFSWPMRRLVMCGLAFACLVGWLGEGQDSFKAGWQGFAQPLDARTIAEMDKLTPEQIYSNAPDLIAFHTGKLTAQVPPAESVKFLPVGARAFLFNRASWRRDLDSYSKSATLAVRLGGDATMIGFDGGPNGN